MGGTGRSISCKPADALGRGGRGMQRLRGVWMERAGHDIGRVWQEQMRM